MRRLIFTLFAYSIIASFFNPRYHHATHGFSPITVTTRTTLTGQSPNEVQAFLASPGNWPKIVTTSMGVESSDNNVDVSKPLPVGSTVDEIFGLPPIIPLSVQWTCTKDVRQSTNKNVKSTSGGRLEFFSPTGLNGVAQNCAMIFQVQYDDVNNDNGRTSDVSTQQETVTTQVVLTMKYEPISALAVLAVPILTIDNFVALKFLLPAAIKIQPELDKFRTLMGGLYGVAGLAHFGDCIFGSSELLTMAGAPTFAMLSFWGKLYALLWCFAGPVSFGLSKAGGSGFADMGLILYGLIEVGGAALIAANYDPSDGAFVLLNPTLINAILVQAIVAGAWLYSANKKSQ